MTDVALYRFFDAGGALLYVGITHRLNERLSAHKRKKPWDQVARIAIEHYPTRQQAADAEVEAINSEHPAWNVVHSPNPGSSITFPKSNGSNGSDSRTLEYQRFLAWRELGLWFGDMCDGCHGFVSLHEGNLTAISYQSEPPIETMAGLQYVDRFSRGPIDDGTLTHPLPAGSVAVNYQCPICRHRWFCTFSEDFPVLFGADQSMLRWILSLFPPGRTWSVGEVMVQ